MLRLFLPFLTLAGATPALACQLALVLAVDVSGSVDRREYDIQMQGLAEALRDGAVVDALVAQQAQVTLIQWTGASRQRQTIPWRAMHSPADVAALADDVASGGRVWRNYATAIGEALIAAERALEEVAFCTRKVIDVSGDGISNEGVLPSDRHPALAARDITVNALAIETDDADLTGWFFENLIRGAGAFVMTARGFEDYPTQIKRKLRRETVQPLSLLR
ncbi:DUF1194 domain-containing protein [uncultured Roseobacter sp.]|uniref:DUF1194 domain-containing protein n=1 Tax=uncultured Roseobacter sp. TaxID=114847 RepID=UPI0026123BAD|nr:DUF1194 domain-containing protein [uncultured Roseobacter sp.]